LLNGIEPEGNEASITKLTELVDRMTKDLDDRQTKLNTATNAAMQKQTNFDNEKELETKLQEIKSYEAGIKGDEKERTRNEAEVTRINGLLETVTDKTEKRQLKIALKIAETAVNDLTAVIAEDTARLAEM
jgi:predicted RND superfamily exporter protein